MSSPTTQLTPSAAARLPVHWPRERLYLLAILLLWAVIYLPALFRPPLLDDADSVHAEAAR